MKRGFLFYVGFLLLIIFGAFLVMLVVMFCSPGTEILGMKYFAGAGTTICRNTTDASKTELSLIESGKYSEIQINCSSFAEVKVQKTNEYKQDCIAIVDNSNGFVLAKDEVKFNYSILIEGSVLKINVTEPKGFLFFSKNIEVVVHIASTDDEAGRDVNPFGNTKFVINTKGGDVTIGGDASSPYSGELSVGELQINSGNGNVAITSKINYDENTKIQTFKNLNLSLGSGKYTAVAEEIHVNGNLNLQSTSGKFNFENLLVFGDINIKTESGRIDAKAVMTDNIIVECNDGYFYLDEVYANLKFPGGDMTVKAPYTKITKLTGELIVLAGENSTFEIFEVFGNVNIQNTSGKIKIGDGQKGGIDQSAVIKTNTGSVNVTIKDGNDKAKEFEGETSTIDVYFAGQATNTTAIKTKGNVNVKFVNGNAYTFMFNRLSSNEDFDMNKVKFKDFPSFTKDDISNPFVYNAEEENRGIVNIRTDGNVNLSFLTA